MPTPLGLDKSGIKIGDAFERLTVVENLGMHGRNRLFRCRCSCSNEIKVSGSALKSGNTRSCGCLRKDVAGAWFFKHGATGTGAHNSWLQMIRRCTDPNNPKWRLYGGRGIRICGRWMDAANFIADMGERPPGHSIERINVEKGYEPGNCRWATQKEQTRNTRKTIYLVVDGVKKSIFDWSEEYGIPVVNIRERYFRGWDHKRAVQEPLNEPKFSSSNQPSKSARS